MTSEAICAQLGGTAADQLFFSTDPIHQAVAKSLCAGCPIAALCRDTALAIERGKSEAERFGVFGGTTPAMRYAQDPGRACADCGTSITHLHELARRCPEHQARHRHTEKLANARRNRTGVAA